MKVSKNGQTILVENPLCGNTSFSKALGLFSDGEIPSHSLPSDARKKVGAKWAKAHKIILVRDPVSRFLSGLTLALNSSPDQLQECGASEDFVGLMDAIKDMDNASRVSVSLTLDFLRQGNFGGAPTYMLPQRNWLSAKFDLVLATNDIAEYFNSKGEVSCNRSNVFYRNPALSIQPYLLGDHQVSLKEVYKEDFDLLDKLLVWSPLVGRIRLVSGYCVACERKREGGEMVDLRDFEESAPPKKSTTKRKRARQSGKSKS